MSFIKPIVQTINQQLNAKLLSDNKYADKWIIGIAQSLPVYADKALQLIPSYVDNNGESIYVGPDDTYDYIAYHRVNSWTPTKANLKSYGDTKAVDANIVRMSYVVFGRRDRLQMSNDELAFLIQMNFNESVDKTLLDSLQLKTCNINITDIILNDLQVFKEEFQGVEFFLKPEQFLFKINYTIESAFIKKCFTN